MTSAQILITIIIILSFTYAIISKICNTIVVIYDIKFDTKIIDNKANLDNFFSDCINSNEMED